MINLIYGLVVNSLLQSRYWIYYVNYLTNRCNYFSTTRSEAKKKFMVPLCGITWCTDEEKLKELRKLTRDMCNFKRNGFPGSQPVSMSHGNLELLKYYPYRVSWKADGTR